MPQQAATIQGEEQVVVKAINAKQKKNKKKKHNVKKQKKTHINKTKRFLGFIFLSFCGLT